MGLFSSIKKGINAVVGTVKAIIKNPVTAIAAIGLAIYAPALALRLLTTMTLSTFVMGALSKDAPTEGNSGVSGGNPITLMPDTTNKLPAIYGTAYLSGMVTDAKISSDNQTMWYIIPLTESPDAGSITFGEMYWGEKMVTFSGSEAGRVVSFTNNAGQVDTKVDGNMWVYFYNNGSNSPTNGTTLSAITILSDGVIPAAARWDATKLMTNTAFIIVKLIYSSDDGITGLDQIKIQVTNNQTGITDGYKPGSAMKDYLLNSRYGADLDIDEINTSSFDLLDAYSDEVITYTPVGGGSATQPRYRFNGAVDTSQTIMTNLQLMADSCDSYIQYNETLGQWSVIANKAYDQLPNPIATANLFKFTDDNIIGGINITPLDLNSTPNAVESKFRNGKARGRDDYAYAYTPDRLKSFHEPFNQINMAYAYVDDSVRAQYLSNRKLEQARADIMVDLTADYSAIQVDAGDVVLLTYEPHGGSGLSWNNKPFRVIQVQEERTDDGVLICKLQMSEYSDAVYDNFTIQDYTPPLDNFVTDPTIISTPDAPTISNILSTADVPSFQVSAVVPSSGVVYGMEFWYGPTANITNNNYILYDTQTNSSNNQYSAGDVETITVTGLVPGTYYWRVRSVGIQTKSSYSAPSSVNSWTPSIESVTSFSTEFSPTAIFCSADFDGSNVVVGQTATLSVRSGPNIVTVWDKTGVQPDNTWYGDTLTTSAGLTTGLLLTDAGANTEYFTVTGLSVDAATATIGDIYYKPSGSALINIGQAVIQVSKVKNGAAGAAGKQYNTAYLHQWSPTTPSNPSGNSTFVWATGTNTSYTGAGGWTVDIPTNPGTPGMKLWISSKSVDDFGNVASTTVSWTSGYTVSQYTQNGDNGAAGANGLQTSYPEVYQWTAGGTPTIAGSSTYTWATGTFTPTPAGWSTSIPTSPSAGYTLWAAKTSIVETGGILTSNIDWTTASIVSAGYAGTNGTNGAPSVIADLSSEVDVVPTLSDGTGYTLPANNAIRLYVGGVIQTTGVSYSGTATKNGLTATVNATTGAVTYTGTSWTSTRETFTFTATYLTISYTVTYSIIKGISGSDSILPDLVSETDIVAALSDGTGYTLPSGNELRLYKGATIVSSGVSYSGTTTKNGLTATINATTGDITLSGASWVSDTESFTFTATYNAVAYTSIYTISKGKQGGSGSSGLNGTRTAILDVYQWSSTVPTTFPSGTSTYTWSTSQFTMPATTNGWSLTSGSGSAGQTLYIARQTYADTNTTATSSVTWSTVNPIAIGVYGLDGAPGAAGESVYTADVFIQSATAPTAPTGGSYNFSTGALVAPAGWSVTQPSTTTTPTYAVSYTFRTTTPATTVTGGTWTDVRIVAVAGTDGGTGASGTSVFVGAVYIQQSTSPTAPSGGSYNFSTNTQVAPTGWTVSQPASTTTPTWVAYYTFSTTTPSTTVTGGTYSAPVIDAQNGDAGSPGTDGLNGTRTALLEVYQWASSAPTTFPSGDSTYTWATGAFTLPATPNSWSLTPGAATAGYTLWATRVVYSDSLTTDTSSVTWPASNSAYAVGAAGTNGAAGTTGNQGASARRAYSRIPGNPSPTSGQVTVVGDGRPTSAQSNTTWGLNYSWTANDPLPTSTDSLFQVDGVYDPATGNTVWDTPYLSSLRVGTLSAITTNTGDLNVTGTFKSNDAQISGNTMTGSGAVIYSDGTFAMGTPDSYIVNNGTEVFISGFDTVATSSSTLLALSAFYPGTAIGSVALTKDGKGTVTISGYISVFVTSAVAYDNYAVYINFGWKNAIQPAPAVTASVGSQAGVFRRISTSEYIIVFPMSFQLPLYYSAASTYTAYLHKSSVVLSTAGGTSLDVTSSAIVTWNGWAAFNQTRI